MAATLLSRITLAYLEDIKRQDIQPFCDDPDKRRCVNFDKARGHCNMFNHQTPIPDEYQYMDENFKVPAESRSRYGGWDAMEYCPFIDVCHNNILNLYIQMLLIFVLMTDVLRNSEIS
ncbi:unnamed protein product [Trichobilharzia regenti]|nr:unnamed protein product [Trichobilharzia regenti]